MRYTIEITPRAGKQLADLSVSDRRRIGRKIDALGTAPRPAGCVKLEGGDNLYRVRVGDYRIVYAIRDDILYILVVRIGHRREVYRHT